MFDSKKKSLIENKQQTTSGNAFVEAAQRITQVTLSENEAKKYKTTGNALVDQFGNIGEMKTPRSFDKISVDSEKIWNISKDATIRFIIWLRLITRQTVLLDGTKLKPQSGAGLKNEAIMRMIWLHLKDETLFWNNIAVFIAAGSWKDIFQMLSTDLQFNGWENRKLNWNKFSNLILSGLDNENSKQLILKYIPKAEWSGKKETATIEKQANVLIGKWIIGLLFQGYEKATGREKARYYKQYRVMKSSGTAHEWQQLISQRKFERIDFDKIHGRALKNLVQGKFLKNQGLTAKYEAWVGDPNKKEVKFTGFVHELFNDLIVKKYTNPVKVPKHEADTINKQFNKLIAEGAANEDQKELIVVRDTSGSMGWDKIEKSLTPNEIAKSLAIYFSEFLTGRFKNAWIEFNDKAEMHTWVGKTPVEKFLNDKGNAYGSTNFQSVIDLFIDLKRRGVKEEEFPKGILALSDGEFNPADLDKTNVEQARDKLSKVFSKKYADNFIIILWNINRGQARKFDARANAKNTFFMSGYDGSMIKFLTSGVETTEDVISNALNQEIFDYITV